MNEEDALLRAICEHPDEDMPRLAFADWLDEQGTVSAAWAELIRVQMALARGAGDPRERLVARERELAPVVVESWPERMGLPVGLMWQNWTRGFPFTLAGPGELIRAAHPRFAGRVPLCEFNFRGATDADLLALATWTEARLVRKLGVWTDTERITERAFIAMVDCEHLGKLERLRMERVQLTERAAVAFLDSPFMAGLLHLKLLVGGLGHLSSGTRERLRGRFGEYDVY
ncbi:TIGR02996 domain-containing protein [Gemmata sp. G18]|uniref:TIGR02996 domain-containing protein n=1 Tax=Gemmata palustris TaxID=2822762 RepID=A0ABS5C4S5_9BACT|nr:TIGR02996 domain-containing protein [Gemmata palustris]MBP3960996.1 TIGR02996 domain-containing protein [Gemmata palustris]